MLLYGSLRQVVPVGLHHRWHQQSHQHSSSNSDPTQTSDSVHAARHPGHGDGVHQRGRSCLDRNSVPTVRVVCIWLNYKLKHFFKWWLAFFILLFFVGYADALVDRIREQTNIVQDKNIAKEKKITLQVKIIK